MDKLIYFFLKLLIYKILIPSTCEKNWGSLDVASAQGLLLVQASLLAVSGDHVWYWWLNPANWMSDIYLTCYTVPLALNHVHLKDFTEHIISDLVDCSSDIFQFDLSLLDYFMTLQPDNLKPLLRKDLHPNSFSCLLPELPLLNYGLYSLADGWIKCYLPYHIGSINSVN